MESMDILYIRISLTIPIKILSSVKMWISNVFIEVVFIWYLIYEANCAKCLFNNIFKIIIQEELMSLMFILNFTKPAYLCNASFALHLVSLLDIWLIFFVSDFGSCQHTGVSWWVIKVRGKIQDCWKSYRSVNIVNHALSS
jgi:hypothetical protein